MFHRLRVRADAEKGNRPVSLREEALENLRQGYDVTRELIHVANELATISDQLPDSARQQKEALLGKAEQLIELGNTLRAQQGTTASVLVNLASANPG